MQPLDLNLASRPYRNNTLLWVGHVGAVVLLLLFTVWSVTAFRDNSRRLDELNAELGTTEQQFQQLELRDKRARRAIDDIDIEALDIQTGKANQVIDWVAFSWTRLFNRMAEVQPWGVKMIAVRPIFRSRPTPGAEAEAMTLGVPVLIEGVGKNDDAFYDLQDALLGNLHFSRVDPQRLVRRASGEYLFKLRFNYEPELELLADLDPAAAARLADEAPEELPQDEPGADEAGPDGEGLDEQGTETAPAEEDAGPDDLADAQPAAVDEEPGAAERPGDVALPGEPAPAAAAPTGQNAPVRSGAVPPPSNPAAAADSTTRQKPPVRPRRRGLPPRGIKAKEVDDAWTPEVPTAGGPQAADPNAPAPSEEPPEGETPDGEERP